MQDAPHHLLILLGAVCLVLLWGEGEACTRIAVTSATFGRSEFVLEPQVLSSERPVFKEIKDRDGDTRSHWLYHKQVGPFEEGIGRWFIGNDVGDDAGVAFVDSWAVVPQAIEEMSGRAKWFLYSHNRWREESDVKVDCLDEFDNTLYLCSDLNKGLCGFYFPFAHHNGGAVFHSTNRKKLYWVPEAKRWMLSEDEVGSTSGVAYIDCPETPNPSPVDIPLTCTKRWQVLTNEGWKKDKNFVFVGKSPVVGAPSVFSRLRTSTQQPNRSGSLSNGVALPLIGLGTGGLSREETKDIVKAAITDYQYQLIDTASEYHNEDVIGEALREIDPSGALRARIMVSSKVWPTRLGFQPTLDTIEEGLHKLQSGYFDVYLLHWPFCDENIEWMNCPPTPSGTWQQSWRALEKSYVEGTVRAIGVSNFDAHLLQELFGIASVPPHLVQNWMDPLHVDQHVLAICAETNTMFQAYSLVREWVSGTAGDRQRKQKIRTLASENGMTIPELILRWALQLGPEMTGTTLGAVVRSKTRAHLDSNMAVVKREPLSAKTMQILSNVRFSEFRNEL